MHINNNSEAIQKWENDSLNFTLGSLNLMFVFGTLFAISTSVAAAHGFVGNSVAYMAITGVGLLFAGGFGAYSSLASMRAHKLKQEDQLIEKVKQQSQNAIGNSDL